MVASISKRPHGVTTLLMISTLEYCQKRFITSDSSYLNCSLRYTACVPASTLSITGCVTCSTAKREDFTTNKNLTTTRQKSLSIQNQVHAILLHYKVITLREPPITLHSQEIGSVYISYSCYNYKGKYTKDSLCDDLSRILPISVKSSDVMPSSAVALYTCVITHHQYHLLILLAISEF